MENNENAVTQTETVETVEKTEVSGEQPVEKNEKEEVKTFTQDEVNAMLAKEKKKMPCAAGPEGPQCTAQGIQPSRSGASARTSGFQT